MKLVRAINSIWEDGCCTELALAMEYANKILSNPSALRFFFQDLLLAYHSGDDDGGDMSNLISRIMTDRDIGIDIIHSNTMLAVAETHPASSNQIDINIKCYPSVSTHSEYNCLIFYFLIILLHELAHVVCHCLNEAAATTNVSNNNRQVSTPSRFTGYDPSTQTGIIHQDCGFAVERNLFNGLIMIYHSNLIVGHIVDDTIDVYAAGNLLQKVLPNEQVEEILVKLDGYFCGSPGSDFPTDLFAAIRFDNPTVQSEGAVVSNKCLETRFPKPTTEHERLHW